MPLVKLELLTLSEHMSSPLVFSEVRVVQFLVFGVVFCRLLFVLFRLTIALSNRLRFADSDYPFGIFKFKLFLYDCERSARFTYHASVV